MRVPWHIFRWLSSHKARMLNHPHPPSHISSLTWSWRKFSCLWETVLMMHSIYGAETYL